MTEIVKNTPSTVRSRRGMRLADRRIPTKVTSVIGLPNDNLDRLANGYKLDQLETTLLGSVGTMQLFSGGRVGQACTQPVRPLDVVTAAVSRVDGYERIEHHTVPLEVVIDGDVVDELVDSDLTAAATAAIAAVDSCCAHRDQPHWPPLTRPLITSGGLVSPVVHRPFFADRLLRWPGIHDCTTTIRRPA